MYRVPAFRESVAMQTTRAPSGPSPPRAESPPLRDAHRRPKTAAMARIPGRDADLRPRGRERGVSRGREAGLIPMVTESVSFPRRALRKIRSHQGRWAEAWQDRFRGVPCPADVSPVNPFGASSEFSL